MQTKKFNSAYQKIEKSRITKKETLQGRTQLEDDYNFTIVEQSPVKIITDESDGSTTYVMLIERTISENLKFENLIINDKNGILDARIIKYTLSKEPEKEENHDGEIIDIINTEMTTLEIDGRIGIPCVMTYTLMCDALGTTQYNQYTGIHVANWECIDHGEGLFMVTALECAGGGNIEGSGSIGSNGSSSGSGNTGPNGGGVGGTTPTIPTSPIPCVLCPTQAELVVNIPCDQLKEITDNPQILQKINDLKPKTLLRQEFATRIERKYNGFDGIFENSATSNPNGSAFLTNVSTGGYTIANAHNHPIHGQSIPSWGDINWLNNCEVNIANGYVGQGLSANIVVVKDSEVPTNDAIIYAVKIDDFTKLQTKLNNDFANNPAILSIPDLNIRVDKMNDLFGPFFKDVQNNTNGLKKKFLEVFQIYGVSLYKFDQANNKWSKLSLLNPYNPFNPNAFNSVISKPCN